MRNNDLSLPVVQGATLSFLGDGREAPLAVGTPAGYAGLQPASGSAYRGPLGSFTARKERAGNKRGDWYWRAYRKTRRQIAQGLSGPLRRPDGCSPGSRRVRLASVRDADGPLAP